MKRIILSPISVEELEELIRRCVRETLREDDTIKLQSHDQGEEYLTAEEAAKFLKVSLVSLHNWKRDKGLPFYRLGRSVRFKRVDLIAFTEAKKNKKERGT